MKTVCIDPGHGGKDPGATNLAGQKEKDFNLELALLVKKYLSAYPVRVVLTRNSDVFVELQKRAEIANKALADCFVSIHFNAGSRTATGHEILFYPTSSSSKRLASLINSKIAELKVLKNRGIAGRTDLYVLKATKMPACLVEVCFISNPDDVKTYQVYKEKIAEKIAAGIAEFLQIKRTEQVLYKIRVETGTYTSKSAAEKAAKVIEEAVKKVAKVYKVRVEEAK